MVINLKEYRKNSIQKINLVEEIIYEYFLKCDELSNIKKNNIILLFYHELFHFYATTITRNEILKYRKKKNNITKYKLLEFMDNYIRFGWRDEKNLFDNIRNKRKISYKRRLISFIFSISFFRFKGKHLYIGDLSLNNYNIISKAFLKGYCIKYIIHEKVFLDKAKEQVNLLFELIAKIDEKVKINYDKNKLNEDVNYSVESIITEDIKEITKYKKNDVLIIGTPAKFYNRIASINSYCLGANVIGVLHGEESGSVSAPAWRFDDRSCSHSLIGYGSGGSYQKNQDINFLSLDNIHQDYIESDCESLKYHYINKSIETLNTSTPKKGLYISWRLNNTSVINPYDIMDIQDYIEWQNFLLDKYPEVSIKVHPKQKNIINYKNNKVFGNLIDQIKSYDFFIFDYVSSTAFAQIAATNKPIIYYNLGLSKFTNDGISHLKERVIWCDVNICNNNDGFELFSENKEKKINMFTKFFSLSNSKKSRIDALFDTIKASQKIVK
ncbi:hypothetical protein N9T16_02345 [Pelagibacteraceae bacterium]|jgi:hypothetical protein|nr:hypothetical protein [Pelagibacteraceae bacterium]